VSQEDDLKALKDNSAAISAQVNSEDSVFRKGLSLAADVVGIISVVGIPAAVQSFLDFINDNHPLQDALKPIVDLLRVTFSFEQAEADLTQMQNCTALATAAQSSVQAILEESLPYTKESLNSLQNITLTSVNTLEQDAFWRRVFFTELAYEDYWFGRVLPPPDEILGVRPDRSFAFDYRLTLPCYLSAIMNRHQALVILLGNEFVKRDAIMKEIADRATSLERFYNRILKGFRRARTPTFFPDIQYVDIAIRPDPPLFQSPWDQPPQPAIIVNRVVGTVDSYVGDGIIRSYPESLFPNRTVGPFALTPDPPPEYVEFTTRYELGVIKREKQLYFLIGLNSVWESIQDLRRSVGQLTEPFDENLYWSLREIIDVLRQHAPPKPGPDLSLFDAVQRLATIGKVDNSQSFQISWREALEAAAV
jgi:hypothetical protein